MSVDKKSKLLHYLGDLCFLREEMGKNNITVNEVRCFSDLILKRACDEKGKTVIASPTSATVPTSCLSGSAVLRLRNVVIGSIGVVCTHNGAIIPASAKELKAAGFELEVCTIGKKKVYVSIECAEFSIVVYQNEELMPVIEDKVLFDVGVNQYVADFDSPRPGFWNRLKASLVMLF